MTTDIKALRLAYLVCFCSERISRLRNRPSTLNTDKYNILKQRNWICDVQPLHEALGFELSYNLRKGLEEVIQDGKEALGNLMTDAIVNVHQTDFAFQNAGGVRIGRIEKGDLTMGKIYELVFQHGFFPSFNREISYLQCGNPHGTACRRS